MQNNELLRVQSELDASRERYFDLYDLAPVGYCTVSEQGLILEANLSAATLLGSVRNKLVKQSLTKFIFKDDQDIYYRHCRRLFETDSTDSGNAGRSNVCELRMQQKKGGPPFWVRLHATVDQDTNDTRQCRLIISDITESKNAEDARNEKHIAETALAEIAKVKEKLEAERAYLQEEIKLEYNHEAIIGQSNALKYVLYKIEQIASSDTIVLIMGETGTGKELVVRAIHSLSHRKNRAMVKVNCAALSPTVIESELFGHEKGSFTGSQARHLGRFEVSDGSTLFLDEIGELPPQLQSKLLRVVQEGEFERLGSSNTIKVDARIIVATNRNLEDEVRKGCFREDLWYRLNVFPITMPPLRDRKEDIPLLVDFYIKKISKRLGKKIEIIPENVMEDLQRYNWPGNIRELQNVLERGAINSSGGKLRLVDDLTKPSRASSSTKKTLEAVERDYIVQILEHTEWKVSGKNSATEILGLNRSTLRARMRKLGIIKP
ncbi:MAG: sigma 54-interacting transcriptional regulator [Desulfamplus sp.]|nr:sigma 54-interacting transcriptional regulator [Desulfamplus sp.]